MAINGNVITGQVTSVFVDPATYCAHVQILCNTEVGDSIGSMPAIIESLMNGETPGIK